MSSFCGGHVGGASSVSVANRLVGIVAAGADTRQFNRL